MVFAELSRKYRARRGLFISDQAEELKISVSMVSAMETGRRSVPEGYPERVALWLGLDKSQTAELVAAAAANSNVIKFRPKDANKARFASELSRRLNELSDEELEKIRNLLDEGVKAYV